MPASQRLPSVSVAGKAMPLETLIRDKIMQRGKGGAHQLRKAFHVTLLHRAAPLWDG